MRTKNVLMEKSNLIQKYQKKPLRVAKRRNPYYCNYDLRYTLKLITSEYILYKIISRTFNLQFTQYIIQHCVIS